MPGPPLGPSFSRRCSWSATTKAWRAPASKDSRTAPVTTDSARRLHYAREHTPNQPGARVRTLCGDAGFDQARYDALREANPSWWKPIDITTLPACKTCQHAANH